MSTKQNRAAQVPFARALKAKLVAANRAHIIEAGLTADAAHQRDRVRAPSVRLLDKGEITAIANVTFPTIWAWMRDSFPRSRIVGGKSMWLSSEVEAWLADLPVRPLKGDAPNQKIEEIEPV